MRAYLEIEQIVNHRGIQMRATRLGNLILLVYGMHRTHQHHATARLHPQTLGNRQRIIVTIPDSLYHPDVNG
jgi:hypothetical protein